MSIFEKFLLLNKNNVKNIEYVVVGLGNPGDKYNNTRHNVGFMAIDKIAKQLDVCMNINKFESICGKAIVDDKKILLVKPQTYMNESGRALEKIISFYKLSVSNIIVIADDISLDVGKIRLKRRGSHGGHNGIKSIINYCNSENFPRIKIGVGSKPSPKWDLADWVLSKFSSEDIDKVNNSVNNVLDALEMTLKYGIDSAMNKFN